ncbi:MAG: PAS domain-containing protein [Thermoplasmata archaeon]|nr:MAG: PAS domain-containing protein [Thermoplasmata archaeon]MCD6473992.1 PAS domain-containing protein [Thermoplasmata archaeon]
MGLHQKALDRLEDVICFINDSNEIIFANKAIEKFGLSKKEAIGKNISSVFPFLMGYTDKIFSNGLKSKKWVLYGKRKLYLVIQSQMLDKNVAMLVIKNETKFKDKEEKLKEVKKMYEKILELASESIYIENEEGEIIFANNAFSRMVGRNTRDIVGRRMEDILESREMKKIGNGKYEMNIHTKNGDSRLLLYSSYPLFEKRNFIGKINIGVDVTEERKREEKLKILSEREKNFRLKTAHYFFNPLAIAKGYMGLMAEELNEDEREKVLKAINAISRVENVIKNFVTRGEIAE